VADAKQPPKKKAKQAFYCKVHGADQRHNTDTCKVVIAQIEKIKQARKPLFNNNNNNNQQGASAGRTAWTDNRNKRPAVSYSTEQLKEVVRMTKKKTMEEAKARYESQMQEELHAIRINEDAGQEVEKMRTMELFINDLVDEGSDMEDEAEQDRDELTQAELDELTSSLSA
jgi:hypothetical protein